MFYNQQKWLQEYKTIPRPETELYLSQQIKNRKVSQTKQHVDLIKEL